MVVFKKISSNIWDGKKTNPSHKIIKFKKKDHLTKNYFFISYNLSKNFYKNLINFELFLKKLKILNIKIVI